MDVIKQKVASPYIQSIHTLHFYEFIESNHLLVVFTSLFYLPKINCTIRKKENTKGTYIRRLIHSQFQSRARLGIGLQIYTFWIHSTIIQDFFLYVVRWNFSC